MADDVIRRLVQSAVDDRLIAGAVALVADAEGVLNAQCFGTADAARGRAMQPDAMFWVASMSKPVTGAAAMLLVDEGLLDLDAPIATYLEEFTDQLMVAADEDDSDDSPGSTRTVLVAPPRPPTVRDALSHTAGLPFGAKPEVLASPHHTSVITVDRFSLAHAASVYALTPLMTPPGSAYAYSNAGINTVGRIIEVLSGQSFAAFVDARLLQPLGMKDTTFWPSMEQISRLSKCYAPRREGEAEQPEVPIPQLTPPYGSRERGPSPAGGYFSTAADYSRFGRMLLRGGELVRKSKALHALFR
jgi:CubicO group peptidase (beta-lactamase class C family)